MARGKTKVWTMTNGLVRRGTRSLVTAAALLACTAIPAAARAATPPNSSVGLHPSGAITSSAPAFVWAGVPEATYYFLWIDDDNGTAFRHWYTAADVGCALTSGDCTISPGVSLSGGTWWVQTWNASGGYGQWSAARSYTVSNGTATRMRVLQWNLHHGVGTDGVYDINRIATWIAAMTPDVVMLNEVERNDFWGHEDQPARYEALLESKTGRTWYSLFVQEFGDWTAAGKGHLILSRYPIQATARQAISYDRAIGQATVTVNGRNINLIVTHLDPYDKTIRLQQANEVMAWAAGFAENRILAGDMNAWPDQTSILQYNTGYSDSWTVAEAAGGAHPIAGISPAGATKNGRIDYIFYSKGAAFLRAVDSKVYDTRDAGGVMPSDHRPVVTTFEVR